MPVEWKRLLDNFGTKLVTETDIKKAAYVLTQKQRAAIEAAGVKPERGTTFDVTVAFDPLVSKVTASYYHAERVGAGRAPEPRMGHEIVAWLSTGDEVVIGNIGRQVLAFKKRNSPTNDEEAAADILRKCDPETVMHHAKKASGKPGRRIISRQDFVRNPYVVAAALLRSNGRCEMPACTSSLFSRDDGTPYLEVHHVLPLGEGGDDTLVNVAALCPHCHRLLHFGINRVSRRAVLAGHISSLPA